MVPGEIALNLPIDLAPSIDEVDDDQTPEFSDEDDARPQDYHEQVEPSIEDCPLVPVRHPEVLYHEEVEPSLNTDVEMADFKERQERVEKSIRDAIEKLNSDYPVVETGKVVELDEKPEENIPE